jgi:hypothetical protein
MAENGATGKASKRGSGEVSSMLLGFLEGSLAHPSSLLRTNERSSFTHSLSRMRSSPFPTGARKVGNSATTKIKNSRAGLKAGGAKKDNATQRPVVEEEEEASASSCTPPQAEAEEVMTSSSSPDEVIMQQPLHRPLSEAVATESAPPLSTTSAEIDDDDEMVRKEDL